MQRCTVEPYYITLHCITFSALHYILVSFSHFVVHKYMNNGDGPFGEPHSRYSIYRYTTSMYSFIPCCLQVLYTSFNSWGSMFLRETRVSLYPGRRDQLPFFERGAHRLFVQPYLIRCLRASQLNGNFQGSKYHTKEFHF